MKFFFVFAWASFVCVCVCVENWKIWSPECACLLTIHHVFFSHSPPGNLRYWHGIFFSIFNLRQNVHTDVIVVWIEWKEKIKFHQNHSFDVITMMMMIVMMEFCFVATIVNRIILFFSTHHFFCYGFFHDNICRSYFIEKWKKTIIE